MKRREQRKAAAVKYAQSVQSTFTNDVEKLICINDFEAGWEFADLTPRWISVEDELPKKGTSVLIFSSGWNEPMIGYYKAWNWQRKTHMFHSYTDNSTWYNVTHWMPLPAPPVVSNSEKTDKGDPQ